jgi:hypothetical protein
MGYRAEEAFLQHVERVRERSNRWGKLGVLVRRVYVRVRWFLAERFARPWDAQ